MKTANILLVSILIRVRVNKDASPTPPLLDLFPALSEALRHEIFLQGQFIDLAAFKPFSLPRNFDNLLRFYVTNEVVSHVTQ